MSEVRDACREVANAIGIQAVVKLHNGAKAYLPSVAARVLEINLGKLTGVRDKERDRAMDRLHSANTQLRAKVAKLTKGKNNEV